MKLISTMFIDTQSKIAFLVILSCLTLSGCNTSEPATSEQLRPVRYITMIENAGIRTRTFSGISQSAQQSRLSFNVSGTVKKLPISVGDRLHKGDLIAALDASQYQLQVQQAQAALVQAQATSRNTDANYERMKGLYANNNASRNDLDSARANAESANAQKNAALRTLQLAQLNEEYTQLHANADCYVATVDIDINENVNVGTQIASVNCGDKIEVSVKIPGSVIASLHRGMKVGVSFDSVADRVFLGTINEVAVSSGDGATTFPVTIELQGDHPDIRSGLVAEVRFTLAKENALNHYLLPLSAIIKDQLGTYVYVAETTAVESEAIVKRQPVQLGDLTEYGIEVIKGLDENSRVITAGVSVIREGQRVLVN